MRALDNLREARIIQKKNEAIEVIEEKIMFFFSDKIVEYKETLSSKLDILQNMGIPDKI